MQSGSVVGTLCAVDDQPRALSLPQCDQLAEMAADVARQLEASASTR